MGGARVRRATALAALLLLPAACGEESVTSEPAPSRQATEPPQQPRMDGPVPYREIALPSASNAGGDVTGIPVALASSEDVRTWVAQFSSEPLRREVSRAVQEARAPAEADDEALLGAVLSIACEPPAGWSLERLDGELRVRVRMPKQTVQCLVPVTTVAVLAVEEDEAVGLAGLS